jgi:MarR family transcriptional regulator, organic hydroperoxide resistance regulator
MPETTVITYTDPILARWAQFMRTRNLLYKLFTRDLTDLGIKPEQLGILNILKKYDGIVTPSLISRVYRREPHTISVNLKRLEAKGLIRLVKDLQRRNMIRVEITATGEEIWERGIKKTENVDLVFAELTPAEISQLDSILKKLAQATQKLPKSGKM